MARSNSASTLLVSAMLLLLAAAMLLACAGPAHAGRSLFTTCDQARDAADLAAKYCTENVGAFDCAGACSSTGASNWLQTYCVKACTAAQGKLDCAGLASRVAALLCPNVSMGK
jgi:hypothetical protein